MHGFWTEVFKRSWTILDPPFRRWTSWLGIAVSIFGIYWIDQADLIRRRWLGAAIGLSLLFFLILAVKKAIEKHYAVQMELAAQRQDEVVSLTNRVRDLLRQVTDLERQLHGQRRVEASGVHGPIVIGRSSARSTCTGTTCGTKAPAASWPTASTSVRFS
jgi:hypothetical protein